MPQIINCPTCKTAMQVSDNASGKFRCPACKNVFTVGAPARETVGAAASTGTSTSSNPSVNLGSGSINLGAPPKPAAGGAATLSVCPACKSPLLEGAISCLECGFLVQAGPAAGADEAAPNLCPNPACGVANPPGERTCQRCGTPLPHPPGTVLHNRYRIERLLAMGGFGAVYLASDLKNGDRQVAIKDMICQDPQEFAIRLNFFRREAEILRSLDSVSIVPRVYDLIEQGQTAQLAMEFIRGKDMLKLMEGSNNRPFPVEQVIEWSRSICDVLQHMHSQTPPLVHRDLKPENIMLLEDQRSIKMIDFGTARDLGRTQKEKLAAKTRVYTEGYAPPEQIIGKPEARSDLFALAGTMYHLATGKAPDGYHTATEIDADLAAGAIAQDQRWFYELIKINLAEDPNERYFSAREIKADLEKRRVTREVNCPKCQQANKAREPYCHKCGEPLTDTAPPCHACGKSNRMGSRFCIHCGNRLR
jgi:predicted Ser/Thr protein kinase